MQIKKPYITYSTIKIFLLWNFMFCFLYSQHNDILLDNIPRDRVMTDAEFFNLFDPNNLNNEKIFIALEMGDTLFAKKETIHYFKQRSAPKYFFDAKSVTDLLNTFIKNYPTEKSRITNSADEYINTYGKDVNWKLPSRDLLGRKQTPNSIRFLARQAIAFEISLSYYIKNNIEYYTFIQSQIRDFIQDYETGNTESGRNDVFERFYGGHRLRNWLMVHNLLLASSDYTFEDHIFMIKVFFLHGARLFDSCKKFHWGNHQLHGLVGLYEMSIMYPEFPVMNYWNNRSKEVIIQHISTEIKPDGFQFERASHYFKLDIFNYFRVWQISKLNNVILPEIFLSRFNEMFEAIVKLSMPNRKLPVLQDAQDKYNSVKLNEGDNSNQITSNNIAELKDPDEAGYMSLGALIFNNSNYRFFAEDNFPADFYWFLPEGSINNYNAIEPKIPEISSIGLDSSKYFVMRSGWDTNDLYMIIDGGLAKYKPDHTHGGILGIISYANGETILPNYRVKYSESSYRTMKNSLVKNVAICDNILQGQQWVSNHARTGFGIWDQLPKPNVNIWHAGKNFDIFSGSHNGFDDIGVNYNRFVLFFKPDCWLVIDKFNSNEHHKYQQIWQGEYQIDSQNNAIFSDNIKSNFYIMQADPSFMSIKNKKNYETHSVIFEKEGEKNYSFYTLLAPIGSNNHSVPEIQLFERSHYLQVMVTFQDRRFSYYEKKIPDIQLDELKTNAEQVLITYENNILNAMIFVEGTYAIFEDREIELGQSSIAEYQNKNFQDPFNKIELIQIGN